MGLLVLKGSIDLNQFWPAGQSDADTTNVKLKSFVYDGKETHIFDEAAVHGRGKPSPVVNKGPLTSW